MIEEQDNKTKEHRPTLEDYGELAAWGGKINRASIEGDEPETTLHKRIKKSRSID